MSHVDLHMHSTYSSDGTYTPAELMELCYQAGLTTISLTDHNSARGVKEAAARAAELGIRLIPGVEMDCMCQGINIHLLGYGIDPEDGDLRRMEEEVLEKEREASEKRIRLVLETGIIFDADFVLEHSWQGVVTGEMIGEAALREARNRTHPLMKEFYPRGHRSDNPFVNFYWDVCSPGKPAYAAVEYSPFEEMQRLLEKAGGVTVVAHPGQNIGKRPELIRYMKERGVAGLEVYSSYHSLEQVEYYSKIADGLGLQKTAGSDFHGKTKPSVRLGVMPGLED